MQFHIPSHTRPLLDPALHLKIIDDHRLSVVWDRTGSFPSDTATLFFALATVILLENRWWGLFCFLWTTMVVAIPRVIFAWHYPSDIIGSLILGPACVFLFSAIPYPTIMFERVLMWFEGRMYIVHALLFIFLIDAANLFQSLQQAGKTLVRKARCTPSLTRQTASRTKSDRENRRDQIGTAGLRFTNCLRPMLRKRCDEPHIADEPPD
jgi:PAP2 superfamily protein